MFPINSRRIHPTALNRNHHGSLRMVQERSPKQQAVRSTSHNFYADKTASTYWSRYKTTPLNVSNVISHQTTPLFGLWQGYNSESISSDQKLYMNSNEFNKTGNLFLPGQNKTEIIAHIGTTVVMDCKIVRPDLDEYAPVSFNMIVKKDNQARQLDI